MIWNLWQYILLLLWTIGYLRNQIKLLSLRTQCLYMRIDIQCTRLNPCLFVKCFIFFPVVKLNTLLPSQFFTKTHKGHLFYALSFTYRKNEVCFCFFLMQQIFNEISHNEPTWQKRDIDSFPWRTRRTEAALTWCGFLLPGAAASGLRVSEGPPSRASQTWEERS